MTYRIVDADHVFKFTKPTCPICGAPIIGHFEAWDEAENGLYAGAENIKLDCTSEPEELGSYEWECWFRSHWSMPYVDWLPLEIKVSKWINERFRFKL